ncbi:HAD-IA family hydrolase [Lentilactobacillus kosonis]|uniref:Hydrolase, haloacid dehalogenase-like family n=1 Tax=Lentilactobacillus kosonis TaxID=2810561 RepID=A0A401FL40_9LACO|nr:HAD-IA family hydrolase [Lentilactobacillus kosonis]GAY73095.1 hydrolase, haloacid dehalogenase-like family [Lentilactobacillus kosonis]
MINNLIWDFDGTLFDTYPQMVQAFTKALNDLDIDSVEIDEHDIYVVMRQHSVGAALKKYAAFYGINESELAEINAQYQAEMVTASKPFIGSKELLDFALDHDGGNYLVTHRNEQAKTLLANYGLLDKFSGFVTSANDFPRKPKPDSLNWLKQTYDLVSNQTMMIGDRQLDVEAGNNANVNTALFDVDHTILHTGNPDIRVTSLPELLDF